MTGRWCSTNAAILNRREQSIPFYVAFPFQYDQQRTTTSKPDYVKKTIDRTYIVIILLRLSDVYRQEQKKNSIKLG